MIQMERLDRIKMIKIRDQKKAGKRAKACNFNKKSKTIGFF